MTTRIATLGGGCFWCIEGALRLVRGVISVTSGYAAGAEANPTYEQVCSGTTGHAEVVQIEFDDAVLDYRRLLEMFFVLHDPTTRNRQGNDLGTQYRSIIIAHDLAQRETAQTLIAELDVARIWPAPIVTELVDVVPFYPAESYHQDYFARNPSQGYCSAVIRPKLAKFREVFADELLIRRAGREGE